MEVHAFSNINITFVGGMNPGSVKFFTVLGLIRSLVTYCCQIWRPYLDCVGTLIRSLAARLGGPILSRNLGLLKSYSVEPPNI